jgi:porphobilinogen synthase
MKFPIYRPRRLRQNERLRGLIRETELNARDLVMPYFVCEGTRARKPVASMPGVCQLSVDELVKDCAETQRLGVGGVILFGLPARKDEQASGAYADDGIVQRAVRALRAEVEGLVVITDVCLCEYMSHGHCGIMKKSVGAVTSRGKSAASASSETAFIIDNDATLELLAKTAVSHARAGADIVAPSDMMDGRVAAIRRALDAEGLFHTPIMSYAAKFASAFYGPFRDAAQSPPQFGDRRSYQMDSANAEEALREVALDIEEGADIVMVKPGLGYQDILWRVKERFHYPTAVYNVSGEYAMLKAAAKNGWLDERAVALEMLTGFKRAGADLILTYWANAAAQWLAR